MNKDLQAKILAATVGTKFGAILRCALNVERDAVPRFVGKATATSDGFVMCDFVDADGEGHWGAFVGSRSDLVRNMKGLAGHLQLTIDEEIELQHIVAAWLGIEIIHIKASAKQKAVQ